MDRRPLVAAGAAAVLSGIPSTAYALATGRSVWEATRAAGTLLLDDDEAPAALAIAGLASHAVISLGWGVVLFRVLPTRRPRGWGVLAGLGIAALDLGVIGRRFSRIAALPTIPQLADHAAFGFVVAHVRHRV